MLSVVSVAETTVVDSGTFGADGNNLSWSLTSDGVLTISGTGAMEDFSNYRYTGILSDVPWSTYKSSYSADVVVTSVVIEEGVTTIGEGAFYDFTSLASVSLPSTLLEIHAYAFVGAVFTSIDIPASVTSIDATSYLLVALDGVALTSGGAFRCGSLTTINVSDDNKYYSDIDGVLFNKAGTELVFYPEGRTNTSYVIPDGVTTIADGAFYNCQYLQDITVPSSVTSIGVEAFCSETIKTVTISENVSGLSIDKEAFLWSSIKSIDIPAGVTNIEESAFRECYSLSSINVDKNNQNYCDIDGVLLTKDLTILIAYPRKAGNTSYAIPDGVERIGNYAFDLGVTRLEVLYVPDTVTSIGYAFSVPFGYSSGLTDVYYYGSEAEWKAIDATITAGYNEGLYNATIHYNYSDTDDPTTTYTISVPTSDYGTVTVTPTSAEAGDTITVTVTANTGYTVSGITVVDGSGNTVTVSGSGGTYTFTMPDSAVTITPAFTSTSSSTDHTHTYVLTRWAWSTDYSSAFAVFYCSSCGDNMFVPATVTSSYTYGVLTKTASLYYDGVLYTDSQLDTSTLIASGATTTATSTTTTDTSSQVIVVDEPVEDTDTELEVDTEESSEPEEVSEPVVESNPTTGIVFSLIPMAIAALAVVSSKRR